MHLICSVKILLAGDVAQVTGVQVVCLGIVQIMDIHKIRLGCVMVLVWIHV